MCRLLVSKDESSHSEPVQAFCFHHQMGLQSTPSPEMSNGNAPEVPCSARGSGSLAVALRFAGSRGIA